MPSNQHYVPQFLLRPFGWGKKKSRRIWVFDKTDSSIRDLPIKDVASGDGFYDLYHADKSLDPLMWRLETQAAPLIRRLIDQGAAHLLTHQEKCIIGFLVAVQKLRTPTQFADHARRNDVVRRILTGMGATSELLQSFPEDPNNVRDDYVQLIANTAPTLVPHLVDKTWFLSEASNETPLWLSDNPVTLHNVIPAPPLRGNLGLGCKGICVYLPLSPILCLNIACKETTADLALRDIRFACTFGTGGQLPLLSVNVEFHNSLQVINSERYLFSSKNDFALAISMLSDHPDLRTGPRQLVVHPDGDSYPRHDIEAARKVFDENRRIERRRERRRFLPNKKRSKGKRISKF
jgi:Protein of unknown function (DUF4238)